MFYNKELKYDGINCRDMLSFGSGGLSFNGVVCKNNVTSQSFSPSYNVRQADYTMMEFTKTHNSSETVPTSQQ